MSHQFFATHPVFTADEFGDFLESRGSSSPSTRKTLLTRREKAGELLRIRRGLYATVPVGVNPADAPIDPYLVASRMVSDAVLGYHTALEFHGKAHSVFEVFQFLTGRAARPVFFRSYRFDPVLFPKPLRNHKSETFGVTLANRGGLELRVTNLDRTLVDILDRPDLGGGWEEIWRSLESIEFFALEEVVEYALLLDNSTTIAKVGFFLDQHRDALMVGDEQLRRLREHRPKKPHYLSRNNEGPARLVSDWNLVVPESILRRSWTEVL
jgi:predicted transcriptional regulator of viral defense system